MPIVDTMDTAVECECLGLEGILFLSLFTGLLISLSPFDFTSHLSLRVLAVFSSSGGVFIVPL